MNKEKRVEPKTPLEGVLLAFSIFLLVIAAVWAGVKTWFPPLASKHGAGIDLVINYLLLTTGLMFVIGHLALGYFLWRFGGQRPITFHSASLRTEKKLSLIPMLLMAVVAEGGVLVLGLPVWGQLYGDTSAKVAITVDVTGEQFGWNVRYPGKDSMFGRTDPRLITLDNPLGLDEKDAAARDDLVLLNELHLPVNGLVRIRLRSKDVLHSFFLPNFRLKQDLVPGMTIETRFVPTKTGRFEIACAELCGFGHYQMRGLLTVSTADEFEQWLQEQYQYLE